MDTLYKQYKTTIVKELVGKLGRKNSMSVPRLLKITLNMGVKDAVADKKSIEKFANSLAQITGQKPRVTQAKKSIATFKLREGDKIGVMVTLRGERMYQFFDKLVKVVLPRLKDFHGVKRESFDGKGNYTLGLIEYSVFPEIDPSSVERLQGLEITLVTTAENNEEGLILLEALGMPFKKEVAK